MWCGLHRGTRSAPKASFPQIHLCWSSSGPTLPGRVDSRGRQRRICSRERGEPLCRAGNQTFHSVHVEAAERLARHAREADVERLVHVSGIGADPASPSPYIRSRGEGEHAVRAAFPEAVIIRSAVMFGPDDAFLMSLTELLRKLPLFAVFGGGDTRLQPAYVEDIGEVIARIIDGPQAQALYELAGPCILDLAGARLSCRVLAPTAFHPQPG
jgi:uncharacterized protein YbjT (DUF2867 family)